MHGDEKSLSHLFSQEDWKTLAQMLMSMEPEVKRDDPKTRKLHVELCMAKTILYQHLMATNGHNSIDASFFVGSVKMVNRIEAEYDALGIKRKDFLIFLRMLLEKFGQQKLIVRKPAERVEEFKKHKRVVEDEDIPVL
jgi:hypothetical protein